MRLGRPVRRGAGRCLQRHADQRLLWAQPPTPRPSCPPQAAEQDEVFYANLELQTWPLQREPVPPGQVEVEYSTVVSARARLLAWGPRAVPEASP